MVEQPHQVVEPREFRIVQTGVAEVVAEELLITRQRRVWFMRWRGDIVRHQWVGIEHGGELTATRFTYYKARTADEALQRIRLRQEGLARAHEFPKLIRAFGWDGIWRPQRDRLEA